MIIAKNIPKIILIFVKTIILIVMNPTYRLLFVCLGNICRSPAAEAVMRAQAEVYKDSLQLVVDSAGTYGGHQGELSDPRMRKCAQARGYRMTHRARTLTASDFREFDYILVMDPQNYRTVVRMAPDEAARNKVLRTADFLTGKYAGCGTVPDPYYGEISDFEYVLDLLENAAASLLERLDQTGRL